MIWASKIANPTTGLLWVSKKVTGKVLEIGAREKLPSVVLVIIISYWSPARIHVTLRFWPNGPRLASVVAEKIYGIAYTNCWWELCGGFLQLGGAEKYTCYLPAMEMEPKSEGETMNAAITALPLCPRSSWDGKLPWGHGRLPHCLLAGRVERKGKRWVHSPPTAANLQPDCRR